MSPHLQVSIKQSQHEIALSEQNVTSLEKDLKMNAMKAFDELNVYRMSQNTTNTNAPISPSQRATIGKKRGQNKPYTAVKLG